MKIFIIVKTLFLIQIFNFSHNQVYGMFFTDLLKFFEKLKIENSTKEIRNITSLEGFETTQSTYKNMAVSKDSEFKKETIDYERNSLFLNPLHNDYTITEKKTKVFSRSNLLTKEYTTELSYKSETLLSKTKNQKKQTPIFLKNIVTSEYMKFKPLFYTYKAQSTKSNTFRRRIKNIWSIPYKVLTNIPVISKSKTFTEKHKSSVSTMKESLKKYDKISSKSNILPNLSSTRKANTHNKIKLEEGTLIVKIKTSEKKYGVSTLSSKISNIHKNPLLITLTPVKTLLTSQKILIPKKFKVTKSQLLKIKEKYTSSSTSKTGLPLSIMRTMGFIEDKNKYIFLKENISSPNSYFITMPTFTHQKSQRISKLKQNKLQTRKMSFNSNSTISIHLKSKTILWKTKGQSNIQNTTTFYINNNLTDFQSKYLNIKNFYKKNESLNIRSKSKNDMKHIHANQNPLVSSFDNSILFVSLLNKKTKLNNNDNGKSVKLPFLTSETPKKVSIGVISIFPYENNKDISLQHSILTSTLRKQIITTMNPKILKKKTITITPKKRFVTNFLKIDIRKFKTTTLKTNSVEKEFIVSRSNAGWAHRHPKQDTLPYNMICTLYVDEGEGSETISSWHYNSKSRRCEWFIYRGSNGNGNRFTYRANCENYCIHINEEICSRFDIVYCEESWLTCKMEYDQYCNDEVINNGQIPMIFCPPQQPICTSKNGAFRKPPIYLTHRQMIPKECIEKKDPGSCLRNSNSVLVYHYDEKYNDCFGFIYSRCGGNSNRFPNKAECMNHCAI